MLPVPAALPEVVWHVVHPQRFHRGSHRRDYEDTAFDKISEKMDQWKILIVRQVPVQLPRVDRQAVGIRLQFCDALQIIHHMSTQGSG